MCLVERQEHVCPHALSCICTGNKCLWYRYESGGCHRQCAQLVKDIDCISSKKLFGSPLMLIIVALYVCLPSCNGATWSKYVRTPEYFSDNIYVLHTNTTGLFFTVPCRSLRFITQLVTNVHSFWIE